MDIMDNMDIMDIMDNVTIMDNMIILVNRGPDKIEIGAWFLLP